MLRGSSPIRLSQLDISPAIQAGALEAQAAVNLASSVNQAVQNFQAKQQEKEMTKMRAQTIEQFLPNLGIAAGTAEAKEVANVLAKDPQALKSMSDLITIGGQRQKQEMIATEFEASRADEEALQKAISVNITPEGTLDKSGLESAYLEFGGTNLKVLDLFKEPGEVKVDPETGIITQDGAYKGQVATQLLLKGKDEDVKDDEIIPSVDTVPTFNTIEEAEAANLPLGTRVIIGGRDAIVG